VVSLALISRDNLLVGAMFELWNREHGQDDQSSYRSVGDVMFSRGTGELEDERAEQEDLNCPAQLVHSAKTPSCSTCNGIHRACLLHLLRVFLLPIYNVRLCVPSFPRAEECQSLVEKERAQGVDFLVRTP
jgi:hypothetical protein